MPSNRLSQKFLPNTKSQERFFPIPYKKLEELEALKLGVYIENFYIKMCRLANQYSNANDWFYRSITTLQEDTGFSRRLIFKFIKILEKNKFILVKREYNNSSKKRAINHYKIIGFSFKSFYKNALNGVPEDTHHGV